MQNVYCLKNTTSEEALWVIKIGLWAVHHDVTWGIKVDGRKQRERLSSSLLWRFFIWLQLKDIHSGIAGKKTAMAVYRHTRNGVLRTCWERWPHNDQDLRKQKRRKGDWTAPSVCKCSRVFAASIQYCLPWRCQIAGWQCLLSVFFIISLDHLALSFWFLGSSCKLSPPHSSHRIQQQHSVRSSR